MEELPQQQQQQGIMELSQKTQHAQFSYIRAARIGFSPESCSFSIPKGYNDGDHIKKLKKEPLKRSHRKTKKLPTKYDMTGYVYKFFVSKNKSNQLNVAPLNSKIKRKTDLSTSIKMEETNHKFINLNEIENYSIYDAVTICDNISENNFEKRCTMENAEAIADILSDDDKLVRHNLSQINLEIIDCINETLTYIIDADTGQNSKLPEIDITNEKCDKNWVLNNFLHSFDELKVNNITYTTATACNINDNKSINVEQPSIELMELSHNVEESGHSIQTSFVPIKFDKNIEMVNELIESFKLYIVSFCKWKAVPILERFEIIKINFKNHLNDLIEIYKRQTDNLNILLKDNVFVHKTFNRNLSSEEKLIQMLHYGEEW